MKKKLSLNKVTIAGLNKSNMLKLKGGIVPSGVGCSPNSMEGDCPSVAPANTCNCTNGCGGGGTATHGCRDSLADCTAWLYCGPQHTQ